MHKSLKKILITSASLLMLASVGTGLTSTNVSANDRSVKAYYVGKTVNIGNGSPKSWVHHGQIIKVYPKDKLDGDIASSMDWVPLKDIRYVHHHAHHHYRHIRRHHARKHYARHHARRYGRHSHHRH